jgi:Fe-Mn family superoxide dismutase
MNPKTMTEKTMTYPAIDYSRIKGLVKITDDQIAEHLKLYQGYVKRTNALLEKLDQMNAAGRQGDNTYQELKRRFGWEFNGMRLHELYFEQLTPNAKVELDESKGFGAVVAEQFGSLKAWKDDFMGVAKMPGIGLAICYRDPVNGRILNTWIEQHHGGHPAGCRPILIVDCFEHAFSVYLKPTERGKYLDDLFLNIDWDIVASRI